MKRCTECGAPNATAEQWSGPKAHKDGCNCTEG